MIFQCPELDPKEREVIGRVAELKRLLGHSVADSPKRWYGLLRRVTFARAVRGSNTIEGKGGLANSRPPMRARP